MAFAFLFSIFEIENGQHYLFGCLPMMSMGRLTRPWVMHYRYAVVEAGPGFVREHSRQIKIKSFETISPNRTANLVCSMQLHPRSHRHDLNVQRPRQTFEPRQLVGQLPRFGRETPESRSTSGLSRLSRGLQEVNRSSIVNLVEHGVVVGLMSQNVLRDSSELCFTKHFETTQPVPTNIDQL